MYPCYGYAANFKLHLSTFISNIQSIGGVGVFIGGEGYVCNRETRYELTRLLLSPT